MLTISKKFIIIPFIYGTLCLLLINFRAANYAGIVIFIAFIHLYFILWRGSRCNYIFKIQGPVVYSKIPSINNYFFNIFVSLSIFTVICGIGFGVLIVRIYLLATWVDGKKPEIEMALKDGSLNVPGMYFEKLLNNGSMDIGPCWNNNVIIYYDSYKYCVVLPVTRPLPMSFTSFRVIYWDNVIGWRADKIHWLLEVLE